MEPASFKTSFFNLEQCKHLTPLNSYKKSQDLAKYVNEIAFFLCNPATSWETQRQFRNLMENSIYSKRKFQLVCTRRGYITPDGDWQLPRFKEVNVNKKIPMHQGLAFDSQDLIESVHSIDSPPNYSLIKELFNAAQKTIISWHEPIVCSEANTYVLYMTYIAMGISSNWIKKIYCFGKLVLSTHNKELHPAISITDDKDVIWMIDPSLAAGPLRLLEWSKQLFGKIATSFVTYLPYDVKESFQTYNVKVQNPYLFVMNGNERLKYSLITSDMIFGVHKSKISNISSFAFNHSKKILKNPILAQAMRPTTAHKNEFHNDAIDKINRYISKGTSLPPMPEDIKNIKSQKIFDIVTISNIAFSNALSEDLKIRLINKNVTDMIRQSESICTNLANCLTKMNKLNFHEIQLRTIELLITKKIKSITKKKDLFKFFVDDFFSKIDNSYNKIDSSNRL